MYTRSPAADVLSSTFSFIFIHRAQMPIIAALAVYDAIVSPPHSSTAPAAWHRRSPSYIAATAGTV